MFNNLKIEMFKSGIKNQEIQNTIKAKSLKTVSNKLNGLTDFTLSEMFLIQKKHFPELTLEYLFNKKENQ